MRRFAVVLIALLAFAVPAAHATTYTFTGHQYSNDPGHLTGTFTTAAPLPAFMPFTDVSGLVATASFNGGTTTRTLANSVVCSFQVATDAGGNITKWRIELRQTPFTTGNPQHSILTVGEPDASQGVDTVGTGSAGAGACDPIFPVGATTNIRGSWMTTGGLPSSPVTYTYTGDPYVSAISPYSTVGSSLNGTFTTANPLPAFMPLTDITTWMSTMSFHDSLSTATLFDHFVCSFKVATDGTGAITEWQILLRSAPIISFVPEHSVNSTGIPGAPEGSDVVGHGIAPPSTTPCAPMPLVYDFAGSATEGTWTSSMPPATQPTTYTYTGDPFTSLTAPYTNGSRLTGSITTSNPLPSPRGLTDISGALASFTFTDGVQTRTLANSALCDFRVATDSAGNITDWRITLRQVPFTTGNPQQSVESSGNALSPEGMDTVGTGLAGATACSPIVLTAFASNATQGGWTQSALPGASGAPTLGAFGLALLSLLLAAAALYALGTRT